MESMAPRKTYSAPSPKKKAAKKSAAKKTSQANVLVKTKPRTAKHKPAPVLVKPDERRKAPKVFAHARKQALIEAAAVAPNESAAQAYKIAEGAVTISEATAMLKTPAIAGEVLTKRQSLAAEAGITSVAVMKKLAAMGLSSMKDYVKVLRDGSPTFDFSDLTEQQWGAIQEITVEEFVERVEGTEDEYERVKRTKLKLYPAREPLVDIAKHLGIKGFGNRLELVGRNGGPVELAAVAALSDAELERIAAGEDDVQSDDERTE